MDYFDFGGKWGMECLNTKFPLPTLQCAGYRLTIFPMVLSSGSLVTIALLRSPFSTEFWNGGSQR